MTLVERLVVFGCLLGASTLLGLALDVAVDLDLDLGPGDSAGAVLPLLPRRLLSTLGSWARRLARRVAPSRSAWHVTVPGADRLLELRWQLRIRRAPLMTPAEHMAAFADPTRRGADIEIPLPCAICGGTLLQELLHTYDRRHKKPRWDYHVVRCAGCGFLYRHPGILPERLGDLYSTGRYAQFLGGRYSDERLTRYKVTMESFGELLASGEGRRLLDFGCGNGLFLELAYERGFECYGVDLAEDAIEAARQKPSGQHAYYGAPDNIPEIEAGGFDVITMWSVLAHLATPVEDLTMLRRLLAPDGVLLVLTVNAGSLKLRRQLEAWEGFTPNHLLFSSPESLPMLMERAGFGAVVMPPWYGDPIERGTSLLRPGEQRRLRRAIDRGNRGNMLRAAAFVDPQGPRRWGLDGVVLASAPRTPAARTPAPS
jgi:SAM-dependent methyltransferase